MIVTLSGDNSFGWQQTLDGLINNFLQEYGDLALERIDGEEAPIEKVNEALNGLPFLSSKKLVVLRAPSKNKQFTEQAEQLLANTPESTDVIIIEPKLDKRLSYFKWLKSKTDYREFNQLDLPAMANWLIAQAKHQGGELSSSDARYLVERVGLNQQLLGNELEKLLLYNSKITRQTIDLLTEETPQSTIFQLLDAAFSGRIKRMFELYSEQRAMKAEPQQIIAMLAWQLHIIALIKAAGDISPNQIAKDAKISPYVVGKSQSIARDLSLNDIKRLVSDLLDIDIAIKSTSIDSDEALQNYLLTMFKD